MAWRAPRAGDLRDRITIERPARVPNGGGGFLDSWEVVLENLPAKIVATRGGESVQSLRLAGTTPFDITIRAHVAASEITPDHRAINARTGERYAIKWVGELQEGRKNFLTLTCVSGEVANG